MLSVEKVADDAGESRNQIKRYIRLTYLIPELLSMVDDGKIAFNPAGGAFLLRLVSAEGGAGRDGTERLHPVPRPEHPPEKLAQEGVLDDQMIYAVLAETKPNQQEQLKFKREELRKYFPLRLHRGADAPGHHQGAGIAEAAERTKPGCPLIRTDTATIKQVAE